MKNYRVSDCELIVQYKNGNDRAFEQLVLRHKNKIYATILVIVKDTVVAEDLLQETFIKAIKTITSGKYAEEGKFLPWISRIAHNMAIDSFRANKKHTKLTLDEGINVLNSLKFAEKPVEDKTIKAETYAHLRRMIHKLPVAQQEVLMMRHYMQMSFQEIAEETGVNINTALGRMRYALINLRKEMNKTQYLYEKRVVSTVRN